MTDSSENLDPKEATEAKLCAYLEGELSPADRTEIEKHLSANPQHRQLLAELAKTREWMRSIPTVMAPADLSEIFQQQVERSMLLDESAATSRSSMNRWPQVALLAAIVLLVAGLSVVIVAMLRPPGLSKTFSLAKSPESTPVSTPATTEPTIDRARSLKKSEADASAIAMNINAVPAPMAAGALADNRSAVASMAAPSKPSGAMDKLLSPARDFSYASSVDEVKAKLLTSGYHLNTDQKTVCFVVSTDSTDATINQVRGFFSRHDLAFEDAIGGKNKTLAESFAAQTPAAPIAHDAAKEIVTTAPTSAPSETIYVARGLTPLQLELLSASLSTDNLNQAVKRVILADAPTTAPVVTTTGAITKGQTVNVTIPQLVGPGIEKINVAKVAEDGTINLPMIDPLPAAGASPNELEQRIALKYREANLIPQATVIVQIPASTQPSTKPTTQPLVATQPTTLPVAAAQPTTQIVRVDPSINVVVLIENSKRQ